MNKLYKQLFSKGFLVKRPPFLKITSESIKEQFIFLIFKKYPSFSKIQSNILENLHLYLDDNEIINLQYALTEYIWHEQIQDKIIHHLYQYLFKLYNSEFQIQSYPHVRISRPNKPIDNVGFHRDTDYGASTKEISVWVPFTKFSTGSAMMLLPNSIQNTTIFETYIHENNIEKGSIRNLIGIPYSNVRVKLEDNMRKNLVEPRVNFGSVLLIPQDTVHGSELNGSNNTRLSMDIRVVGNNVNDRNSTLERRRNEKLLKYYNYAWYRDYKFQN